MQQAGTLAKLAVVYESHIIAPVIDLMGDILLQRPEAMKIDCSQSLIDTAKWAAGKRQRLKRVNVMLLSERP